MIYKCNISAIKCNIVQLSAINLVVNGNFYVKLHLSKKNVDSEHKKMHY